MLNQLDLNLLLVADSLYRHMNVSKAAKELNLSQSAVSHALARLRDHFKDPLFVRISKGMGPTDLAKELRADIQEFTEKARALSQKGTKLDLANIQARITIATTDYIEILLIPRLLKRLAKEAPHVQISLRPTLGALPKEELESGLYDVAVAGFYKNIPEGFFQTKLFEDSFLTAYRKGHPAEKKGVSATEFYDRKHALITLQGDFKDSLQRKTPGKMKNREFAYGSYSFTGMAWTLAESDLILTAPSMLLAKYKKYFPIQTQKPPVDIPGIDIRMLWHAVTHQDPFKRWFRQVLKEECERMQADLS